MEWNTFNITYRIIDPDFHGRNDEFQLYPNFNPKIPSFESLKKNYSKGRNTLHSYITAGSKGRK